MQGGGVYVASNGVANFEGCDIYDNWAYYVCLPSALALNFHPSPTELTLELTDCCVRVLTTSASQRVSACILNLPRRFFHRPIEPTIELTGCCACAHEFGVAASECLHLNLLRHFIQWNVTCSVFGLQGGGLYITGTATLTNTKVYSNQASVRSLSALA